MSDLKNVEVEEFDETEAEFGIDDQRFSGADNEAPDTEEAPKYTIPCEVILERPVKAGSKTIEKFVFKNPIEVSFVEHLPISGGKHGVQKIGHVVPIIAKMTGQTMAVVKKISFNDFQACADIVNYFT